MSQLFFIAAPSTEPETGLKIISLFQLCEFFAPVSLTLFACVKSNGCATSEDMLWKLEALQSFIYDLHWPDEVFAEHISHRLQLMSTEMIEAAANRLQEMINCH